MSQPQPPESYQDKLRKIQDLLRDLPQCYDAPDLQAIGQDILRDTLPLTKDNLHNYKYREIATSTKWSQWWQKTRNTKVGGSDHKQAPDCEVKTSKISSKTLKENTSVGTFDKMPARMSAPKQVNLSDIDEEFLQSYSTRARQTIVNLIATAGATGATSIDIPRFILAEKITTPGSNHVLFCLFASDGVDPVMIWRTDIHALEKHLGDLFESAAGQYSNKMQHRENGSASARDSLGIKIKDLMQMKQDVELIYMDNKQLASLGMTIDPTVLSWCNTIGKSIRSVVVNWEGYQQHMTTQNAQKKTHGGP